MEGTSKEKSLKSFYPKTEEISSMESLISLSVVPSNDNLKIPPDRNMTWIKIPLEAGLLAQGKPCSIRQVPQGHLGPLGNRLGSRVLRRGVVLAKDHS